MARQPRIPKTREQRLAECETLLYFLWDARRQFPGQYDRYKQIAAELRVLVGDHRPKRRLLVAMMEEFGFEYLVQPPPPPFENMPISMVGWRDDPEWQAVTQQVEAAHGDEEALEAALDGQAALRRPVPFPEYVERGLAVYIAPRDYSHRELVAVIAQQLGSAHEDTSVDTDLAKMAGVIIGNDESHVAALVNFSGLVLKVGRLFIGHVAAAHGFRPEHFRPNAA